MKYKNDALFGLEKVFPLKWKKKGKYNEIGRISYLDYQLKCSFK